MTTALFFGTRVLDKCETRFHEALHARPRKEVPGLEYRKKRAQEEFFASCPRLLAAVCYSFVTNSPSEPAAGLSASEEA
jgi:hypothetical protein